MKNALLPEIATVLVPYYPPIFVLASSCGAHWLIGGDNPRLMFTCAHSDPRPPAQTSSIFASLQDEARQSAESSNCCTTMLGSTGEFVILVMCRHYPTPLRAREQGVRLLSFWYFIPISPRLHQHSSIRLVFVI